MRYRGCAGEINLVRGRVHVDKRFDGHRMVRSFPLAELATVQLRPPTAARLGWLYLAPKGQRRRLPGYRARTSPYAVLFDGDGAVLFGRLAEELAAAMEAGRRQPLPHDRRGRVWLPRAGGSAGTLLPLAVAAGVLLLLASATVVSLRVRGGESALHPSVTTAPGVAGQDGPRATRRRRTQGNPVPSPADTPGTPTPDSPAPAVPPKRNPHASAHATHPAHPAHPARPARTPAAPRPATVAHGARCAQPGEFTVTRAHELLWCGPSEADPTPRWRPLNPHRGPR
jgi:hypothetical protein